MQQDYTAEEVERLEQAAWQFGISVGEQTERERIIKLIQDLEKSHVQDKDLGVLVWTKNLINLILND